MASLAIKGVCIGEGRPKTIVSLMDATEEALMARAHEAVAAGAECVEWRADFARDVHDADAMANTARALGEALPHTPLVFTFRSKGQGGQMGLPDTEHAALVRTIIDATAVDLVDIEAGVGDELVRELVERAHGWGVRTIVSHHDFEGTPSVAWMRDQFVHMASLGADLPKLAVMAHDALDCLQLMEATTRAREELGLPLVAMSMGSCGVLSRLAGEAFGSALTFCALGDASAPGQVELAAARRILGELHEVL